MEPRHLSGDLPDMLGEHGGVGQGTALPLVRVVLWVELRVELRAQGGRGAERQGRCLPTMAIGGKTLIGQS